MKEAKIFSLAMAPEAGQYLLTLEEIKGSRLLPIWIGPSEGMAIAAGLQGGTFPRPLTHDLIGNILNEFKVRIEKIIITDMKDDTFYANILLKMDGNTHVIDARPSDSIAIAVKVKAPIFIEERVFEKCPEIHKPITKEDIDKFKKGLENLKPEDFFKGKGKMDG